MIRRTSRAELMEQYQLEKLLSSFGGHLRRVRLSKGIAIKILEERSRVDSETISRCEKGFVNPGMLIILKLAMGLGVNYLELFDFPLDADVSINRDITGQRKDVDPVSLIRFLMEEQAVTKDDLAGILQTSKRLISDILNYRRRLSKESAKVLSEYFRVDPAVFLADYKLVPRIRGSKQ